MTTAHGIVEALTGGDQGSPELPLDPSIDVPQSLVAQIANKVVRDYMDSRAHGKPVYDYRVQSHGIMYCDYFQGVSTMHTKWDDVSAGSGENAHEAMEDALESLAQNGWDVRSIKNEFDPNDEDNVTNEIRAQNPDQDEDDMDADGVYYYVAVYVRGIPQGDVDESKEDIVRQLGKVAIDAGKKKLEVGNSISHGTMRMEDLLFSYLEELDRLDKAKANEIRSNYAETIELARQGQDDSGEVDHLVIEVLDPLMWNYCPPCTVFGSHPGDSSDIGCWPDYDKLNGLELGDEDEEVLYTPYHSAVGEAIRAGVYRNTRHRYAVWHPPDNADGWELWDIQIGQRVWAY